MVDICPATDPDQDPSRTAEVSSMYVLPTRWRVGVDSQLMTSALAMMAEADYTTAVLWILGTNEPAAAFYFQLGWKLDGAVEDLVVSGQPIRYIRYHLPLTQV